MVPCETIMYGVRLIVVDSSNYHRYKLRDSSFGLVTRSEEMTRSLGLDVLVHGTFAFFGNHEETRRHTVFTHIFRKS